METRHVGRNDPCPCGSGKKYRQCCWLKRFDGGVTGPALLGDGSFAQPPRREPPRQKVRVRIDYTFSDGFGTGQVGYAFERGQKFLLTNGLVVTADRVEAGMRFYLEDGRVATVTGVEPPKLWEPPPPGKDRNGNSIKRIVGTVRYTGHYPVLELVVGDMRVRTTPGHRFFSLDRSGWVDAGSLRAGECLRDEQGRVAPVTSVSPARFEPIELYNVEVEDFYTYFVGRPGEQAVWSHNGLGNGDCGIPKPASTPVGRRGNPLGAVHPNPPTTINGRAYSGHAIDQMQARGIPPSAVENTVQHGIPAVGKRPGTTAHYDPVNNITVITDTATGRVVTVGHGHIKQ